jgi:hypothetical protein
MPLSSDEREFLDAFVYEATNEPFTGRATKDLRERDIYYTDLHWLLTAYDRERCAERRPLRSTPHPAPSPSPWADLEEVQRRGEQLRAELEAHAVLAGGGTHDK